MTVGQRLKAARLAAGITQEELAHMVETTKAAISRYENGTRIPRAEVFTRICMILGLDVDDMLDLSQMAGYSGAQLSDSIEKMFSWDFIGLRDSWEQKDSSKRLMNAFNLLNQKGQKIAVERIEELTKIPEYQRPGPPSPASDSPQSPPVPQPGTDTTPPEKPPEGQ